MTDSQEVYRSSRELTAAQLGVKSTINDIMSSILGTFNMLMSVIEMPFNLIGLFLSWIPPVSGAISNATG